MTKVGTFFSKLADRQRKRRTQSSHLVMAYGISVVCLLAAIIISYSVIENAISTQRTLIRANTLVRDIQIAMTDSIGVINDYREESTKKRPNDRLLQLINRRAIANFKELEQHVTHINTVETDLRTTPVWHETRWFLERKEDSLSAMLGDYLNQMEIIASSTPGTAPQNLAQIPVEAAGARDGALFNGYQKAAELLEAKLDENSNRVERIHRTLTGLTIAVILLITCVVVAPLWRRFRKEHNRLERAHQELHEVAYTDRDTGLPNLSGLQIYYDQMDPRPDELHLLLVRFRNLDEIYNLIGSHKVDELLQSVSRRLQNWNNQQLKWCRSGEAEFSTLVADSTLQTEEEWVHALHYSLTRKLTIEGVIVKPDVSLAVSKLDSAANASAHSLWEHQSNARLASANFQPPGCWLPAYQESMKNKLADQNNLINKISEGIAANEFVPFYQIKVCAKTGTPCSIEVLARWITPDGNMVPPGAFIPVAESSGLIIKLTYSLFDQVLSDIQQWCSSGLSIGRVAINIAGDVLYHNELLDRLKIMNESLPVNCKGIEVEITENIALGDQLGQAEAILRHIRNMGIHVAIDDFGTGYASLQTLLDMPVDVLKIDRSFVLPMTEGGTGNEVISAMISLSNKLNKVCVVEGVETQWQWRQLADLGADELQGFYFHKPAAAKEVSAALYDKTDWKMTG